MLRNFFKISAKPVRNIYHWLKNFMIVPIQKRILARRMRIKHQLLLDSIRDKKKVKVVFLELFKGMWKADPIFKKMLADPCFEPFILVCPCTSYGEDEMWKGLNDVYNYFYEKKYPVISSYNFKEQRWIKISELEPDIIFFSIPHNMTMKEYYEDAYLNYLSCYIPYSHQVSSYLNYTPQYDLPFHNSQWKIFAPHKHSYNISKIVSKNNGKNVYITGYPMLEEVFNKNIAHYDQMVWKNRDNRKRVIWAPHHTIDVDYLPYSNFLLYAENFINLAEKYKDEIFWCFKPHPELKIKLYKHRDWGDIKTDKFYEYWENQEFTQLNLGEYLDLFAFSDAIVHDSGSFLAEYLYFKKPALYMISKNNNKEFYNDFGLEALNSYKTAKEFSEIEDFIHKIAMNENVEITKEHHNFLNKEIFPYLEKSLPSDKIISLIKSYI